MANGEKYLLWLLVNSPNKAVKHEDINNATGRGSTKEPSLHAAKIIMSLRNTLKDHHPALRTFIRTVRGEGYIIDQSWQRATLEPLSDKAFDFLDALDRVVQESIEHAFASKLKRCANGLQYLEFEIEAAFQRYQLLDKMLWDTILALSTKAKPAPLMDLKNTFHELASYVLYWRLGDNLSEQKWREDYRDEIVTKAERIHGQVRQLIGNRSPTEG